MMNKASPTAPSPLRNSSNNPPSPTTTNTPLPSPQAIPFCTGTILERFETNRSKFDSQKPALKLVGILGPDSRFAIEPKLKSKDNVGSGFIFDKELVPTRATFPLPSLHEPPITLFPIFLLYYDFARKPHDAEPTVQAAGPLVARDGELGHHQSPRCRPITPPSPFPHGFSPLFLHIDARRPPWSPPPHEPPPDQLPSPPFFFFGSALRSRRPPAIKRANRRRSAPDSRLSSLRCRLALPHKPLLFQPLSQNCSSADSATRRVHCSRVAVPMMLRCVRPFCSLVAATIHRCKSSFNHGCWGKDLSPVEKTNNQKPYWAWT
ncbi:hypothetical protein Salat_0512800 [Sesamum alatum]|uniref:Uncharacterized protein n=1 Tax=Sesamum alatum TaxID=300844 RepID=A0AAE1Z3Z9_9LAMI|nr:hypothetical protein Salat_0512800 [Sesamum alatum]